MPRRPRSRVTRNVVCPAVDCDQRFGNRQALSHHATSAHQCCLEVLEDIAYVFSWFQLFSSRLVWLYMFSDAGGPTWPLPWRPFEWCTTQASQTPRLLPRHRSGGILPRYNTFEHDHLVSSTFMCFHLVSPGFIYIHVNSGRCLDTI